MIFFIFAIDFFAIHNCLKHDLFKNSYKIKQKIIKIIKNCIYKLFFVIVIDKKASCIGRRVDDVSHFPIQRLFYTVSRLLYATTKKVISKTTFLTLSVIVPKAFGIRNLSLRKILASANRMR